MISGANKFCKYYQAGCDYTQVPPTCIHSDVLTSRTCREHTIPRGGSTCSS